MSPRAQNGLRISVDGVDTATAIIDDLILNTGTNGDGVVWSIRDDHHRREYAELQRVGGRFPALLDERAENQGEGYDRLEQLRL